MNATGDKLAPGSIEASWAERQVVQSIRDALRTGRRAILVIGQDSRSVRVPDAALAGCASATVRLLHIGQPLPEPVELNEMIGAAAGIAGGGGMDPQAMARLLLMGEPNLSVVLAIDNADRLSRESLSYLAQVSDRVAYLSDSLAKETPALQIVFAAKPALRETLGRPEFGTFRSRITFAGELPASAPWQLSGLFGVLAHAAPKAYVAAAILLITCLAAILAYLRFAGDPTQPHTPPGKSDARLEIAAPAGQAPPVPTLDPQQADKDEVEATIALRPSEAAAGNAEEARRLDPYSYSRTNAAPPASGGFPGAATDAMFPEQGATAPSVMRHVDSGTAMPGPLTTSDQTNRATRPSGTAVPEAPHVDPFGAPSQQVETARGKALPPSGLATSAGQLDAADNTDRKVLSPNVPAPAAPNSPTTSAVTGLPALAPLGATAPTSALENVTNATNETGPLKKAEWPRDQYTTGIVTGDQNGTEFAAAYEIATLIATHQVTGPNGEVALRVAPIVGHGGLQNIRDVLTLAEADMSIVPVALLNRARAELGLGDIPKQIVYIAPLYVEEFHILAPLQIRNISDLAGKTVNLGVKNSTTAALGGEIFERLGLKVNVVNLDQTAAMSAMRTSEIAADLVLSSKPVDWLARDITWEDGFHLIAIPYLPALEKDFLPAMLTYDDYPNLSEIKGVNTIGVRSALIAYNWPKGSDRYRLLDFFVRNLFSRFSELKAGPHHPKWREVILAATLPGWSRFPPAQRWFDQQEFESFLSKWETGAAAERARLFQDFMRWREHSGRS